jgi:hypothetical protein
MHSQALHFKQVTYYSEPIVPPRAEKRQLTQSSSCSFEARSLKKQPSKRGYIGAINNPTSGNAKPINGISPES